MAHYFEGARRFILNYCWFVTGEVQCSSKYTFNLILFAQLAPPRGELAEDTPSPAQFISFQIFSYSFIGIGVAIVGFKMRHPSSPPPSLPAPVQIYGRNGFLKEAVDRILQKSQTKKHIAIRGAPGMGKTTSAIGIIHYPSIARHFGKARHWVSCREASDIADELKAQKLVEYISESLDLDLSAGSSDLDGRKNIKYFLSHHPVPRIIVLDNFETVWEPPIVREASEGVLAFLASFPELTILLTTRNAHNPATHRGVSWHQFDSIKPLSLIASRMLFTNLCPSNIIDSRLDDLLHAIDYIPLPVVLMASYGQENFTTSKILEIWNSRLTPSMETQGNKPDGDPMNKLDYSIAMSLEGPLIKSSPEAPVLLRIIASLPGAIRHENLQGIVPKIHDVNRVAAVLVRTSLIMNSPGVWQMHSTIRSFMLRHYPLDVSYQENIRSFYFQLIHKAGCDTGTQDTEHARRLSLEETNAKALLLDTLAHNFSTTSVSISADYSKYLSWNIPSIDTARKAIELTRNQSSPTADSLLPLLFLRLGTLYGVLDNYPKAIEALEEALDRYEKLGQLNGAAQARVELAKIYRLLGEHTRTLQLYSLAFNRFKDVEDVRGMSACLRGIGLVYFQENRYSDAVETIMKARQTCQPDDHTCITDSERELGRVYRLRNSTESIRLSSKARNYHLLHGRPRYAAITLYQKSIALYLRGDYGEVEAGLNEAYEEFRSLKSGAQMGYSVYHLAEMNRRRGSLRQALHLYDKSRIIFEHMGNDTGNSRTGNVFMVATSLECQAELYARLCQPDKAKHAYSRAHALLKNIEGRGKTDTHCRLDFQSIPDLCEPIWGEVTFQLLTLLLSCIVLCLLLIHRR